jgi:chromosome segregation ATPase
MMSSLFSWLLEPGMYFAIGFLLAALLSLPFMAAIHRRAVRLTSRRLDSHLPLSMEELRAEKDLLRSEFAVSTTRLQSTLTEMQAKTTSQRAEIGRQTTVVTTLKNELRAKTQTIAGLEARETALKDQLRKTAHEHASKSIDLDDARRVLSNKEVELARFASTVDDRDAIADHQGFELAKARLNVEALKMTVEEINDDVQGLNARLIQAREDSERASHELAQERGKVENLGRRLADIEIELIAQRNEAEALAKVTAERIGEQARVLAAREYEGDRLRVALESAYRADAALRYEFAQVEERNLSEGKVALAAKAVLEVEVGQLRQERLQLQAELRELRRQMGNSQASERAESASMRTRIDTVADHVANLHSLFLAAAPSGETNRAVVPAANISASGHDLDRHEPTAPPSLAEPEVRTAPDDQQPATASPATP